MHLFFVQNSADVLKAVKELSDNIHKVFLQEFLFLIVFISQLMR